MTTDGSAMMGLLDQRLDALDRALLGLVSRSERISMVADIEKRLREKQESDSAEFEMLPEVASVSVATGSRESAASPRKRSRLALSSGILGIVALGLMLLLPFTYIVIGFAAEMIGEAPAIALIAMNVLAIAGTGILGGVLSLAAIVSLSRSKKGKRGLGWAITGLCTSPVPALAGLLATVFFLLPITMEYASNSTSHSGDFDVASVPMSVSLPVADCSNGVCVPPPPLDASSYAYAPPMLRMLPATADAPRTSESASAESIPRTPVPSTEIASKPTTVTEVKPVKVAPALEIKPVAVREEGALKPETSVAPASLPPVEAEAKSP